MKKQVFLVIVIACILVPVRSRATVADSAANGFTVKVTLNVQASPEEVYKRTIRFGDWWNHAFSGDPRNFSFEEKAMGCWCEKLPNGGAVRHMEVVYLAPGKLLRMSGALGPLQSQAVTGHLSIQYTAADKGTKLEVTYAVTGYAPAGLATWAPIVDGVLTEQFTRLKNVIETGSADSKK